MPSDSRGHLVGMVGGLVAGKVGHLGQRCDLGHQIMFDWMRQSDTGGNQASNGEVLDYGGGLPDGSEGNGL